ncbi:hypothetical protein [Salinispora pacifica]|uniref:hypothetical protein n=1 Tax=Salinispora pacifica TaxID=351187 RepID=UPI0004B93E7D|nr:hypothetical protein [Salinispora pacifica]
MQAQPPARTVRLTASRSVRRVGRHLRAVHEATAIPGRLDADLVIGDEDEQIAAAQADVDLVILDGHGYLDEVRVGRLSVTALRVAGEGVTAPGFVLGCCWGAAQPFVDALTGCLDAPTTLLGCAGIARFEHAEPLFVALLRQLADCAPGQMNSDRMREIMTTSLTTVIDAHPRRDWARWRVIPLVPVG